MVAATVLTVVAVAVVLLRGGDSYKVDADFVNAGNLVEGNLVTVAGEQVGTVESIELTDEGRARARLTVSDEFAPLRAGTRAVVRKRSLSSVANDVIELQLGGGNGDEIDSGGRIPAINTESDVPIDSLFNTFDAPARRGVQGSLRFFRDLNRGREDRANAAFQYLSPALAAGGRLFDELSASRPDLERFLTATASLTTDIAAKDDALAGLVEDLGTTMRALATRREDLGAALDVLPSVLRRTNTTFVNLRATLGDLDPLVAAARPAVRSSLRPLFAELRPFAAGAAPTVRDLSRTIRRPGADNDLVELLRSQPALDRIANVTADRNGKRRPGAFPTLQSASRGSAPQLEFLRPYSPELVGWFDDFSTSGAYDALGSFSRAGLALNQFTLDPLVDEVLPVPPELRRRLTSEALQTGRNDRCPGSLERPAPDGTNPFKPSADFDCDLSQVPVGP